MADEPINLNEQRALREENNKLWTPRDCVNAFLRDMDNGTLKPERVLIIYEETTEDGDSGMSAYRANVQRDTEIALLWLMLQNATRRWMK